MDNNRMILAGDIGGTKTVIALYQHTGHNDLEQLRLETFPSQESLSLDTILNEFLKQTPQQSLHAACFGVAGPVINGQCHTTNLPWSLSEAALAKYLNVQRVKLLNDLEATAYGMLFLGATERVPLNQGKADSVGNIAVVAAGTGLGEAMLYWDGNQHHPIASEGGHCDFAPRNDREIELLKYLRQRLNGHVSYERILSGPGLFNIYQFLRDTGYGNEPNSLREELRTGDPSATISRHALAGDEPLCVAALEMFAAIYGAEAGNLALKCLAAGGVYIGGGIAPKILPALNQGIFMEAFLDKGRFATLLKDIPVSVATNPQTALLGAAQYALRMVAA
jgi:glucokinase